ncbi:MAG: menaquinone biosynthesis protein, partial [Acidobacteria bacterium]|nr:menaquinone biosynthesis protein [Acidobacteriota bacterium]
MQLSSKLRVGIVDFLNAWPLAWGFLVGELDDVFEPVYLPPAEVARELAAGRIDIGLIPSIEVQRVPDLTVVPGLCVAATHEVRSVILLSRGPIEGIRRLALDRNSRTSAALVQILLQARYGIEPTLEVASPDADEMLSRADAALIIGDPALHLDRAGYQVWDLAAEWRRLTGLPFVFAVWAVRSEAVERAVEIGAQLTESLDLGLGRLEEIAERAQTQLGVGRAEALTYLTENLSYRLDPDALAGLREFYLRAADQGLIERPREL